MKLDALELFPNYFPVKVTMLPLGVLIPSYPDSSSLFSPMVSKALLASSGHKGPEAYCRIGTQDGWAGGETNG